MYTATITLLRYLILLASITATAYFYNTKTKPISLSLIAFTTFELLGRILTLSNNKLFDCDNIICVIRYKYYW